MSEENAVPQTTGDQNTVTNDSTKAETKNVPYDRFQEVVSSKNEMASQLGKLQAQIDKMNSDNKSKAEAKMVEDGKLKEALDIVTKERDTFKGQSEQWNTYQSDKRESLMSKLTDDTDKSIADGLSDLNKLETYVNKVVNVNVPFMVVGPVNKAQLPPPTAITSNLLLIDIGVVFPIKTLNAVPPSGYK